MFRTSIGYHTFTISLRLTVSQAFDLLRAFKDSEDVYILQDKKNKLDPNADWFTKQLHRTTTRYFHVKYHDKNKGISWTVRLAFDSPGFIPKPDGWLGQPNADEKTCSVKARINPKLLTGITDYITAASKGYLHDVIAAFDQEAMKLSPLLESFGAYAINRIDYCVNFDLKELGITCLPERMMTLLERGDIPHNFEEQTELSKSSRRRKPLEYCFYLINNSVVVNCYWKHYQQLQEFPDAPDIEQSRYVICFEIQFKYPKVKNKERNLKADKGFTGAALLHEMLSDEVSNAEIHSYFDKVIRPGDYFTLEGAIRRIEAQVEARAIYRNTADRLILALRTVNRCRGIAKAKAELAGDKKYLEEFRRSLRELAALGVNPVTIPEGWNIRCVPNLLTASQRKLEHDQATLEIAEEYIEKHKRKEKK